VLPLLSPLIKVFVLFMLVQWTANQFNIPIPKARNKIRGCNQSKCLKDKIVELVTRLFIFHNGHSYLRSDLYLAYIHRRKVD